MRQDRRKKKFLGNAFQKKLLLLIFASAVIPAGIVGICLYYLIFNLLAWQIGIPEAVAYNLIPVLRKVNLIIIVALPVTLVFIWRVALRLSQRLTGPLYRIEKELDAIIAGEKRAPIRLRKKDELQLLVDKLNKLILK